MQVMDNTRSCFKTLNIVSDEGKNGNRNVFWIDWIETKSHDVF